MSTHAVRPVTSTEPLLAVAAFVAGALLLDVASALAMREEGGSRSA